MKNYFYLNIIGYVGNCEYVKIAHRKVSEETFEMYRKRYEEKPAEAQIYEQNNVKSIDIYI